MAYWGTCNKILFDFGTPEDTARLFFDEAVLAVDGPGVSDIHYEEMNEDELKTFFVYLRIAYGQAARNNASDEVMDIMTKWYDEVFVYILENVEGFRTLVCSRIHVPIGDWQKYWNLAGCG